MSDTATTGKKVLGKPFAANEDPRRNLRGRPKGSRHKIGETFLEILAKDFERNGLKAIQACRRDEPAQYVKIIASLLPKEIAVTVNPLEELTDEQLAGRLAQLQADARRLLTRDDRDNGDPGPAPVGKDVPRLRPN